MSPRAEPLTSIPPFGAASTASSRARRHGELPHFAGLLAAVPRSLLPAPAVVHDLALPGCQAGTATATATSRRCHQSSRHRRHAVHPRPPLTRAGPGALTPFSNIWPGRTSKNRTPASDPRPSHDLSAPNPEFQVSVAEPRDMLHDGPSLRLPHAGREPRLHRRGRPVPVAGHWRQRHHLQRRRRRAAPALPVS